MFLHSPLGRLIACCFLLTVLAGSPLSAGDRWFYGGGIDINNNFSANWTRPQIGEQVSSPARWESTSFFVSRSGSYTVTQRTTSHFSEAGLAFPRAVFLYVHDFDPAQPQDNLVASFDLSNPAPESSNSFVAIANNTYHLVVSTLGPEPILDQDDIVPTIESRISGPGEVSLNLCTFEDEGGLYNDSDYAGRGQTTLNQERGCVWVSWVDPKGKQRYANVAPQHSSDSALFYFFDEANWELNVKLLDGCAINNHYWLLLSASTDVEFELNLQHLGRGAGRGADSSFYDFSEGRNVYRQNRGQSVGSIIDINALTCDG
jgi:hypothetical protein